MSSSIDSRPEAAQTRCWRVVPRKRYSTCREGKKSRSEASHSAKYQRATSKMRPSRLGSRELNSRVLQWLVLCGIPYRGSGMRHLRISPDPANQLPTSLIGQATRPPGGSTAHLQLPKSSTHGSSLQICNKENCGKLGIARECDGGRPFRAGSPRRIWQRPVGGLGFSGGE